MTSEDGKDGGEKGWWGSTVSAMSAVGGAIGSLVDDVEGTLDEVMGTGQVGCKDTPSKPKSPEQIEEAPKSPSPGEGEGEGEETSQPLPTAATTEEKDPSWNMTALASKLTGVVTSVVGTVTDAANELVAESEPPTKCLHDRKEAEAESEAATGDKAPQPLVDAKTPEKQVTKQHEQKTPEEALEAELELELGTPGEEVKGLDSKEMIAKWWVYEPEEGMCDIDAIVGDLEMELAVEGDIKPETLNAMGGAAAYLLRHTDSPAEAQRTYSYFTEKLASVERLAIVTLSSPSCSPAGRAASPAVASPASPADSDVLDHDGIRSVTTQIAHLKLTMALFYDEHKSRSGSGSTPGLTP